MKAFFVSEIGLHIQVAATVRQATPWPHRRMGCGAGQALPYPCPAGLFWAGLAAARPGEGLCAIRK